MNGEEINIAKMEIKHLHIKNMICPRCIKVVRDELNCLGIEVKKVDLGYADILMPKNISLPKIAEILERQGFEIIVEEGEIIIEKIKHFLLQYLEGIGKEGGSEVLSYYLSRKIGKSYSWLSHCFSEHESKTIEKYFILLKIERVKELLDYNQLNLSQIASLLGYSNVNHLSAQFKKITGMSATNYRKNNPQRKSLCDI